MLTAVVWTTFIDLGVKEKRLALQNCQIYILHPACYTYTGKPYCMPPNEAFWTTTIQGETSVGDSISV